MTTVTTDNAYESLLPEITPVNQPFWDGCNTGELRLQRCQHDGTYRYPDSPVCPKCLSPDFTWEATSGRGTLWSWIVMHQKYFPAFSERGPYLVAFVELEEGPFLISALADTTESLRCGQPLEVGFAQVTPTRKLPIFKGVTS
jgi:uncharacterized OB-fold protein